jgi:hypothetical protein
MNLKTINTFADLFSWKTRTFASQKTYKYNWKSYEKF